MAHQGGLFDANGAREEARTPSATASAERPARLVVLDGHAMVYRAFFALQRDRPMTVQQTGERVEAVYSFTSTLFKAIGDLKPTHLAIAFDPPGGTFRHEQFDQYKANRPEMPDELHHQVERVKELMRAMHVPIYEVPGFEADDVIGSIASECGGQGIDTVIFTGDTDTLQLVTPHVRVLITSGFGDQKMYDEDAVRERYDGLEPHQQIDVKALEGDTSDNVPGVPGIGRKTAIKLIQQYGSVDALYEHLDEVAPPRIQGLLREHQAQALSSKELVTIVCDAPTDFDLAATEFGHYRRDEVLEVFRALEFSSLVARIPPPHDERADAAQQPDGPAAAQEAEPAPDSIGASDMSVAVVDTAAALEALAKTLAAAQEFALVVQGSSGLAMTAEVVGLGIAVEPGSAWYVPIGHAEGKQLPLEQALGALLPLLGDAAIAKVGHNLNYGLTVLAKHGLRPTSVSVGFDTMVAAQLLGDRAFQLKQVALNRLGLDIPSVEALTGTGRKQRAFADVAIGEAAAFAGGQAETVVRLRKAMAEMLDERSAAVMRELEMPLVPVLVQMQLHGIALDLGVMEELDTEISQAVAEAERAVYEDVGHEFNIGSPQQLSDVLFKELKLPPGKRTQTGYSTDAATLEGLVDAHPAARRILEYRELSKLKSTYVDTLPQQVNPQTHRIHTTYNQVGAATGRLASNDPNLQNIPVRTELGRRVRGAFVAEGRPQWTLLAADYSQVELRVLAHLSHDNALIQAFAEGQDIHASTAALVYSVPLDEVTSDMRRLAKVLNFGVIYGLSPFGIAQQTELTVEEGAQFIETYLGAYPQVRHYIDETVHRARTDKYVETLLGRRRYIPEITSSNRNIRQAAERIAINMPVQGTAADIIKAAMVDVQKRLEDEGMASKMLLQVHDELVFETPQHEQDALVGVLEEIMPRELHLVVPVEIEIRAGYSWGELK